MKKILIAIPHYGSSNRKWLYKCLSEYNKFKNYSIDVHLYTTDNFDIPIFENLSIYNSSYDSSIGQMLVHEHKLWFNELKNDYDYYIYCEDDVFITSDVFESYVDIQSKLKSPFACGLMRYEFKDENGYKFLFDQHPVHSVHRGGNKIIKENYIIKDESYFEVYNIHQGCYILNRELLNRVIDSGHYLDRVGYYAGHPLEGAASDVYYKCGIIKLIPRNRVNELLVHHLPNKYVNMLPEIYTEDTTPNEIKISLTQTEMAPTYVL